mgnify:CR=1 FL=1
MIDSAPAPAPSTPAPSGPSPAAPAPSGEPFAGSTASSPPDPGTRGLGGKDTQGARPIEPELEELLKDASDEDVARLVEEYDEAQKAKKGETDEKDQKIDQAGQKTEVKAKKPDDKAPAAPKVKLKVGDEEKEIDHAELERAYNLALKLEPQAKDALELHEASVKTLRGLVENPAGTLMEAWTAYFGGDRDKAYSALSEFADSISKRNFELAQMPESERALLLAQDELKTTKERLAHHEKERQATAQRAAFEQRRAQWETDISNGLKAGGLPIDKRHLTAVADVLVHARQTGIQMPVDEAVKKVKMELQENKQALRTSLTYEDIKDNQALIEEIRRRDLQQVQAAKSKTGAAPNGSRQETEPPRKKRRISTLDEL